MRTYLCGLLTAATLALTGCSSGSDAGSDTGSDPASASASEAGCTVRIDYAGTTYRYDAEADPGAATTTALGDGRPVDCDGVPVPDHGSVEVAGVDGVDPGVAIVVVGGTDGELSGVYVAEGVTDLPDALTAP